MTTEQNQQSCIDLADKWSKEYGLEYFALCKMHENEPLYVAVSSVFLEEYLNDGYMFLHKQISQHEHTT